MPAAFEKRGLKLGSSFERVIPVGGVTRIPFIRRKLAELFDESKIVSEEVVEPILAVVIGAAFKKEKEHYSISVPPFGFMLQYREDQSREEFQYLTLVEPFAYYEFYKGIVNIALPRHSPDHLNIDRTYYDARLLLEDADGHKKKELASLGNLQAGRYAFSVELDGDIYLNRLDGNPMPRGRIPLLHPLQLRISKEKENRKRKAVEEIESRHDDSPRSMTFEN